MWTNCRCVCKTRNEDQIGWTWIKNKECLTGQYRHCRFICHLLHKQVMLVHFLLVNQFWGIHKVLAIKQDDHSCNGTSSTPKHHISQGLCPCVTWKTKNHHFCLSELFSYLHWKCLSWGNRFIWICSHFTFNWAGTPNLITNNNLQPVLVPVPVVSFHVFCLKLKVLIFRWGHFYGHFLLNNVKPKT